MITREADYAIRLVTCLAGLPAGVPVGMPEVAQRMDIPYRFLRKLAGRLVGAGLVESRRGRGGGLTLARAPRAINLLQVIGAVAPTGLVLSLCAADPRRCGRSARCRVRPELARLQVEVRRRLARLTVDRLAVPARSRRTKRLQTIHDR